MDGLGDDAYETQLYAEDILAVIKKQKLHNYVLYGHSYGTVHATVTAALIERRHQSGDSVSLPKGLVLEGTVGRAYRLGESLAAYQASWSALLARLPAPAQEVLRSEVPPFSTPSEAGAKWGSYLQSKLYGGRFPRPAGLFAPLDLELKLQDLGTEGSQSLAPLRQEVENTRTGDGYGHTFRVLGCREVFSDFPAQFILKGGELLQRGNYCEGIAMDHPYDSGNYDVSFPVFYFQGTDDQATPLWQAHYHHDRQHSGKKRFVTVEGASHMPLIYSLFAAGCRKIVWTEVLQGGSKLKDALAECRWPWAITMTER